MDKLIQATVKVLRNSGADKPRMVVEDVYIDGEARTAHASLAAAVRRYNEGLSALEELGANGVSTMAINAVLCSRGSGKYALEITAEADYEEAIEEALAGAIFLDHGETYEPYRTLSVAEIESLVEHLMKDFSSLEQRGVVRLVADYNVNVTNLLNKNTDTGCIKQLLEEFRTSYMEYYSMLNDVNEIENVYPLYITTTYNEAFILLVKGNEREKIIKRPDVSTFVGAD